MSASRHATKRTPAKPPVSRPEKTYSQPGVSVESLVRQLTAQAKTAGDSRSEDASQAQVLIDTEVDGVRCLLVRQNHREMSQISLSPREREIARMVAIGHPNKAIAAVLEISSWTVCTHLRRIFAKLGVSSRAVMVARTMDQANWSDGRSDERQDFVANRPAHRIIPSALRPASKA